MFSWVKAHKEVYGNEMPDNVAKAAGRSTTTRYEYTRMPKSYLYHVTAEEAKQKWQAEWITSYKAAATKLFSIRSGQTRNKTNTNHEASSRADRARENEGISLPLQTKGRREMYMRPERPNHGSSTIPLREDQRTARGPKTQITSTTKLDGN